MIIYPFNNISPLLATEEYIFSPHLLQAACICDMCRRVDTNLSTFSQQEKLIYVDLYAFENFLRFSGVKQIPFMLGTNKVSGWKISAVQACRCWEPADREIGDDHMRWRANISSPASWTQDRCLSSSRTFSVALL